MINDAVFRSSVASLAVIVVIVGLYTFSLKKMLATYLFGMFAVCGVILPDWEFFDRSFSQWCTPINVESVHSLPSAPGNYQNASTRYVIIFLLLSVVNFIFHFCVIECSFMSFYRLAGTSWDLFVCFHIKIKLKKKKKMRFLFLEKIKLHLRS